LAGSGGTAPTATLPGATSAGDAAGKEALLLDVRDLVQEFPIRNAGGVKGGILRAVSGVSFTLRAGEALGIVGETGSGKSTLARSVIQAPPPKSGEVIFDGVDLVKLRRRQMEPLRRHMQMVFQDPFGSLDPKWRVYDIVAEPLVAYRSGDRRQRRTRVAELLDLVGLDPDVHGPRRPGQLSGGQAQRVAIARAIALHPQLVICDEAVSSLDVLVQAQVLNLFEKLRQELGLAYLFIAHDLALVKQVSDRVMVLYLGKLCEMGPSDSLYEEPLHPYTLALLKSVPDPDPETGRVQSKDVISGELPSPLNPPSGCRFRTRCPRAQTRCAEEEPQLRELRKGHVVACHFPLPGRDGRGLSVVGAAAAPDDAFARPPCAPVAGSGPTIDVTTG
ncbi:MAG TPA: oligopeptide/dipeptide ABC transporter ATP-binding protein, partial [Acidimicrobiales bacterium]|nr:oligopeptide/dipeptide ABC transporter ATP-binding protein [Acidimicrobiales bacterium]